MKRRVTLHNGRADASGRVYQPRHNDRDFDVSKAEHIDSRRTADNLLWNVCEDPNLTFEDVERRFYDEHFSSWLESRNSRYEARRHYEQVRSMDDIRKSKRGAPEECIIGIGRAGLSVDPQTLSAIWREQVAWERAMYPQCVYLDWSLHQDEAGQAHIHARRVWIAHDKAGNEHVSESAALREMGVPLPFPGKRETRHNNRKMSYTASCRAHLEGLCREYGIVLEEERLEPSRTGLSLEEYKAEQIRNEILDLERARSEAVEAIDSFEAPEIQERPAGFLRATPAVLIEKEAYDALLETASAVTAVKAEVEELQDKVTALIYENADLQGRNDALVNRMKSEDGYKEFLNQTGAEDAFKYYQMAVREFLRRHMPDRVNQALSWISKRADQLRNRRLDKEYKAVSRRFGLDAVKQDTGEHQQTEHEPIQGIKLR